MEIAIEKLLYLLKLTFDFVLDAHRFTLYQMNDRYSSDVIFKGDLSVNILISMLLLTSQYAILISFGNWNG